jgi:hypothetical protein
LPPGFIPLDLGGGFTFYFPFGEITNYALEVQQGERGSVKESDIREDILAGINSPWGVITPGVPTLPFAEMTTYLRTQFIMDDVSRFVDAFNQIHDDSYLVP